MREVSNIMVTQGMLEDVEDIWFLQKGEIKDHLWDMVTSWATNIKPYGVDHLPKEIAWRKGVYEKFKEWDRPEAMGIPPEVVTEPFTIVLWGVTNESMTAWSKLRDIGDPENVTEMTGFAASPGIVEGVARVCRSVKDIGELQEGEILVSPTTSPSWAPAFQKIKAVVTDVGGIMSHAAIVCREYGMPAIVGTGKATSIIKTGMRIKVDGNTGKIDLMR
ncbi:MAG: PEP-utilizing enzyme, mobile region, partial [Proteobacteria bacterium]|nr:PEP-utilizing enzyme, mobile region [Pseudomonadota bacterium]